jgi:16S rRNA (cytosine1402-N4)-methyltransferase
MTYHVPVLLKEVLAYLVTDKSGSYLDCTLGGGGHSRAILDYLSPEGKLLSIDRDASAIRETEPLVSAYSTFSVRQIAFSEILSLPEVVFGLKFDGILLDLGVSSHQIDTAGRGFSYMADGELDMRMDKNKPLSAFNVINEYTPELMADVFWRFGEEKMSRQLATAICRAREKSPIKTTGELKMIIESSVHHSQRMKSLARVFQAIRIEVNGELNELSEFLNFSLDILNPNGRVGIIAYHSLEDRMVKTFINEKSNTCVCPPGLPRCVCDQKAIIKKITNSAVKAKEDEIKLNNRARSALFRVYEKV